MIDAVVPAHPLEAATAAAHRATEGEEEVALRPGLQVETEGVEAAGELPVVVEVLVEVGLAVSVEVVETGDLVVGDGVDDVVDDRQTERLVPAGGEAFPGEVLKFPSMPETIHTSPSQVQTAALPVDVKKSKPPMRICTPYGFS